MNVKEINTELLAPPHDAIFSYLYERVVNGGIPLFLAEVPLQLIQPYSEEHRPHESKLGKPVLDGYIRDFSNERLDLTMWVYPRGSKYILSDDYFSYFALLALGVPAYRCFIMGHPTVGALANIKGPAPLEFVRKLPGGSEYDPERSSPQVVKEKP